MKTPLLLTAALSLMLVGCASLNPQEVAVIRARGVPAPVVAKIEDGQPLAPAELIGLSRRRVPDALIIRHLELVGVDYLVSRADVIQMRRAGVSARVIDAMLAECDRFARRYQEPYYANAYDYWWADSVFFGPSHYHGYW